MGCDITYYLDHDLIGLSALEFFEEFKRRVAPLPVVLTGLSEVYPTTNWNKGSPYRHNKLLPNCWEIDCFLYDFETQYNSNNDCINIRLHHENIPHGWELSFNAKTMCFFPFDDDCSFLHGSQRWRIFREEYLMNRDKEIEKNIQAALEEISQYIAPVFHCTKMIAIGDQGLHQELSCAMDAGASIEEAFECEAVKNEGCHVSVYQHGEDKRFSYANKNELPVWLGRV
ncbi:MAG: hypothetical protein IJP90_10070 [Treponema sp.]|nr:hypothetical protein [Treponema sp.]